MSPNAHKWLSFFAQSQLKRKFNLDGRDRPAVSDDSCRVMAFLGIVLGATYNCLPPFGFGGDGLPIGRGENETELLAVQEVRP